MDNQNEDKMVRQIERNLSNHMNENLILTGRLYENNKVPAAIKAAELKPEDRKTALREASAEASKEVRDDTKDSLGDGSKDNPTNNPADYPFCTFYGNVRDTNKMEEIYNNSDVLILTSAYEGLPIVVMQMMAHGKVVVSTAVDAIPDYITDGENGFLLKNTDERQIIIEAINVLENLNKNRVLLEKIGEKSREYAEQHFSREVFYKEYKRILFKE